MVKPDGNPEVRTYNTIPVNEEIANNANPNLEEPIKKQEQPKKKKEVKELILNKTYFTNICIMMLSWSCGSFGFYLIPFFLSTVNAQLEDQSLNVFLLAIASSVAEILACFFTTFISKLF